MTGVYEFCIIMKLLFCPTSAEVLIRTLLLDIGFGVSADPLYY